MNEQTGKSMQKEITAPDELLTSRGTLNKSGWSRQLLLNYDRSKIAASGLRIKEWDYYEVINPDYGIVLLIYDIGYQARAVVKWLDFKKGTMIEEGATLWLTKGALNLPPSSDDGDVRFGKDGVLWECLRDGEGRRLFKFRFPGFPEGPLEGEITLTLPKGQDTIVNAVPFKNPKHFVYAQKINCMRPEGSVKIGDKEYLFSEKNNSNGCLDWSRAVFPYHVEWRWCTASGRVGGVPFGLNIDYGFGTESNKSMIFHNDRGHHLENPRYTFNADDPMQDWVFTDPGGRIDLKLKPVFLEKSGTNFVILKMSVLKVYGFFTGRVVLDDGSAVDVTENDRLFGSAEAVVNYW